MELRKIQITGGSTHVVSLPKKWVDRCGLGRSDAVAIHEEPDGSLLLVPHGDPKAKARRVTLDIPEVASDETIVRKLVGAYLAGADEIRLRSDGRMDPKIRQTIRDTIRDLVGVEILDEGSNDVTVQDLVGVSDMDLRKTVTRMHRIAGIMLKDAMAALVEQDESLAGDVSSRDDELDRLEWHVSKQMHALLEQPRLAARLQVRPAEALNYYLVARAVERIGDHASKICKQIEELEGAPDGIRQNLMDQAMKVHEFWERGFAALKRRDFDAASNAVDEGKALGAWKADFTGLLADLPPQQVAYLTIVADSVDRVRGYAIDIAETAMNHTFLAE